MEARGRFVYKVDEGVYPRRTGENNGRFYEELATKQRGKMTFLILICTLPERANKLRRLTSTLDKQKAKYNGLVDYKINDRGRDFPTGAKRNNLIEGSQSDYFSFCDDDDLVSDSYV